MNDQTATYVIFIVTPASNIWHALTDGKITSEYFFGRRIESDWKVGSEWRMWMPDPQGGSAEIVDSQGVVTECVLHRRLAYTWRVMWVPEMAEFPEGHVTFTLDDMGFGVTRLRMEQRHAGEIPGFWQEQGQKGWEVILSGLKTLLETGKPLPPIDMSRL